MERLTEWDEYGNADIIALSDMMPEIYAELSFSETNALTDVLNRLAAYEDTGLGPEEIDSVFINGVIEENKRLKDEMSRLQPEPNTPLTLEELRGMDGEPVWCVDDCGNGHWMIVHVYGDAPEQVECAFRTNYVWDGHKYRMHGGFGWRAYRRKPEEG